MVALTKHSHLIFGRLSRLLSHTSHSSHSFCLLSHPSSRTHPVPRTLQLLVCIIFFNAYLCTKRMAIIMWMVYAINVNKRYMVDWKDYYGVRCGMMMLEDILLYYCCCCYMHNVNVSNKQTNKQTTLTKKRKIERTIVANTKGPSNFSNDIEAILKFRLCWPNNNFTMDISIHSYWGKKVVIEILFSTHSHQLLRIVVVNALFKQLRSGFSLLIKRRKRREIERKSAQYHKSFITREIEV